MFFPPMVNLRMPPLPPSRALTKTQASGRKHWPGRPAPGRDRRRATARLSGAVCGEVDDNIILYIYVYVCVLYVNTIVNQ